MRNKLMIILFLLFAGICNAATVTADATGSWSTASNWNTDTVPADGCDVVIPTGYSISLATDYSDRAFASVVINGYLGISGNGYLKVSGKVTGDGSLGLGTTASPSLQATLEFSGTASGIDDSSLTVNTYCHNPGELYCLLEEDYTAAADVCDLPVDRDVSDWLDYTDADSIEIRVDEAKAGEGGSTLVEILDFNSTDNTLTLANTIDDKSEGDYVILITRNTKIYQSNAGATLNLVEDCADGSIFGAELRPAASMYAFNSEDNITISGTISGCTYGLIYSSGTISGMISGCTYGLSSSSGTISGTISGCTYGLRYSSGTISGTISGCTYGLINSSGTISGMISGCTYGLMYSSGTISGMISGCTYGLINSSGTISGMISGCTYGLIYSSGTISGTISGCTSGLYNSSFNGSGALVYNNTTDVGGEYWGLNCAMFDDYNDIAGDMWGSVYSGNGTITTSYSSPPSGYDKYYVHTNTSLALPCFSHRMFELMPGETLTVSGKMKIAAVDHSSYIPRIEIVDVEDDTLDGTGNSALATGLLPVYDGTETGWQNVSVSYTNPSSTKILEVYVRLSHSKENTYMYGNYKAETTGGTGGWGSGGGQNNRYGGSSRY